MLKKTLFAALILVVTSYTTTAIAEEKITVEDGKITIGSEQITIKSAPIPDPRDISLPMRICPTATDVQCATEYYKTADSEMTKVYSGIRKQLLAKGEKEDATNLMQSQRAWLKLRDANCKFYATRNRPFINKFLEIVCLEGETLKRSYYLRPYLE